MSTRTAILQIQANTAGAVAQLNALNTSMAALSSRMTRTSNAAGVGSSGFLRAGSALSTLRSSLAGFAGGMGFAVISNGINNVMSSVGAFIKISVNNAASLQAMKLGLDAVNVSTKTTAELYKELVEVAKLPGLDLEGAVRGSVRLQGAGLSADLAKRSLMAFGNALATVGGGREELNGVMIALTQIASKTRVSAEEINQLGERLPQIRTAMVSAFGSADTEQLSKMGIDPKKFIEGIVAQFEKMEKVDGGLKVMFENIATAIFELTAAFGEPIGQEMMKQLGPLTEMSGKLKDDFYEMGKAAVKSFNELKPEIVSLVQDLTPLAQAIGNIGEAARMAASVVAGTLLTAVRKLSLFLDDLRVVTQGVPSRVPIDVGNTPEAINRRNKARAEEANAAWEKEEQLKKAAQAEIDAAKQAKAQQDTKVDGIRAEIALDKERERQKQKLADIEDESPEKRGAAVKEERKSLPFGGDVSRIQKMVDQMKEAQGRGLSMDSLPWLEAALDQAKQLDAMLKKTQKDLAEREKERVAKLSSANEELTNTQIEALRKMGTQSANDSADKLEREQRITDLKKEYGNVLNDADIVQMADAQLALERDKATPIVADSMRAIGGGGSAYGGGSTVQERELVKISDLLTAIRDRIAASMQGGPNGVVTIHGG